jgi:hypothetical protein
MTSTPRLPFRLAPLLPLLLAAACVSSAPPPEAANLANAVAVADLDGDGHDDILELMATAENGAWTPGFLSARLQSGATGTFANPIRTTVGADPVALAVGDIDGDGRPDVVVACHGDASGGTLAVYLQVPGSPGQFAANGEPQGTLSYRPIDVQLADLDGDGRLDLVVAWDQVPSLSVYLQSATTPGTFAAPFSIDLGASPSRLAVADLTDAGQLDLVVTTLDGRVLVLLHDATPGTFQPPVAYQAGVHPAQVVAADLDGDGLLDLVIADQKGALLVLLQDPAASGEFLAATAYDAFDYGTIGVAVADLDGDGQPDVATANYGPPGYPGSESIFIQAPAGSGRFLPAQLYQGYYGPWSIASGVFNAAGAIDLVIADGTPILRFQEPAQPGHFQPPVWLKY